MVFYLFLTGIVAGAFGALLGLGGGVIVIPLLTMVFDFPIHTAIGVSLVGVIATSTGAALVHLRGGTLDLRLGMLLELGTTVGAIVGAITAGFVSARILYLLFAAMLAYNTYSMYPRAADKDNGSSGEPLPDGTEGAYELHNVPAGLALSGLAGAMSGLLGVGGGVIKVPAMHILMRVPLKVATATSNFMVGITASASGLVYFFAGRINPVVAAPVVLGVFIGALVGAWTNKKVSTGALKKIFVVVFIYVAVQMALKGLGG